MVKINKIDIIMEKSNDNIGDLSFDLVFGEEPITLSSTTEEKDKKIEKKEKKLYFFNRFKEIEISKNQNSR